MIRQCSVLSIALVCITITRAQQERPEPPRPSRVDPPQIMEQRVVELARSAPSPMASFHADLRRGDEDDPAYALYKGGYRLILDEHWQEAIDKLNEVRTKYSKSEYAIDAAYWSAYAQKHLDRQKARVEYEKFIRDYPQSTYLDDVVADLAELEATATMKLDSLPFMAHPVPPIPTQSPMPDIETLPSFPGEAPRAMRGMMRKLGQMERMNQRIRMRLNVAPFGLGPGGMREVVFDQRLDPETKLRCDALLALGDMKEDREAFNTLKEVALNQKDPVPLRSAALTSLSKFREADILPVFFDVASADTNPEVQAYATSCIVSCGRDQSKTLETLIRLYKATPTPNNDQRVNILSEIAEVRDERAVTFLADVALSSDDPAVASTAIEGIGQAGKERNRTVDVLVKLFGQIPQSRTEQRESILYTVADIGNDRAVEFLSTVALSDGNMDARSDAISLLGNVGGEKARTVLYRILKGN